MGIARRSFAEDPANGGPRLRGEARIGVVGCPTDFFEPGHFVLGDQRPEYLPDGELGGVAAELLDRQLEEHHGIALKGGCNGRNPVEWQLGRAGLDHGEHVGVDETRFGGNRDLGLLRPQFQDALLKIPRKPGARVGLPLTVVHRRLPLKSQLRCAAHFVIATA